MSKKDFQHELDVLHSQRDEIKNINQFYSDINSEINDLEKKAQEFMEKNNIDSSSLLGIKTAVCTITSHNISAKINNLNYERDFNDLIEEAHEKGYVNTDILDLMTQKEITEVNNLLRQYYKEFTKQSELDKDDYTIAGIIGTLAALIDYFLVTNVTKNSVTPGILKFSSENFWNTILSEEKIKALEEKYKVTYDVSSNTSKISQEILGLCPLYHRFQSLGHDPIIGLVFGVSDLMKGQLTAIDGNGRLIIQSVNQAETKGFIESIITVFGHFLSDVGTRSKTGKILSVPAPFTPLLQLVQVGSIEYNGHRYTVTDLSKKMYYDGYNFNHFIGMSLPVVLIDILIRLSFVLKENFFLKRDVKISNNPKLNTMLCISNGILFSENVGKIAITKNPFAINYISWIATAKYGFKTLKWLVIDREDEKIEYAQQYIDLQWKYLEQSALRLQIDSNVDTYYIK